MSEQVSFLFLIRDISLDTNNLSRISIKIECNFMIRIKEINVTFFFFGRCLCQCCDYYVFTMEFKYWRDHFKCHGASYLGLFVSVNGTASIVCIYPTIGPRGFSKINRVIKLHFHPFNPPYLSIVDSFATCLHRTEQLLQQD